VSDGSDDGDRKRSKAIGNTAENDDPQDASRDTPGRARQRAKASTVQESATFDSSILHDPPHGALTAQRHESDRDSTDLKKSPDSAPLRLPIRDGDNGRYQRETVVDSTPSSAPHTSAYRAALIREAGSSKTEVDVRTPDGRAATHRKLASVPATKQNPFEISDSGGEDGSEAATESGESDASDGLNADASSPNSPSSSGEEGQTNVDGSVDEEDADASEEDEDQNPTLMKTLRRHPVTITPRTLRRIRKTTTLTSEKCSIARTCNRRPMPALTTRLRQ